MSGFLSALAGFVVGTFFSKRSDQTEDVQGHKQRYYCGPDQDRVEFRYKSDYKRNTNK